MQVECWKGGYPGTVTFRTSLREGDVVDAARMLPIAINRISPVIRKHRHRH